MADGPDTNGHNGRNGSNGFYSAAARWQLMVSAAAVMTAIGGALLTLLVSINSLENTANNLSARIVALEAVTPAVAEREVGFRADIAAIRRDMVEIETQFCSEDAIRNLMHANDLRDFSVLWAKVMGGELPISNAYYPHVGRCEADAR
jgi:hypothetical protein